MRKHWMSLVITGMGLGIICWFNWKLVIGIVVLLIAGHVYNVESRK